MEQLIYENPLATPEDVKNFVLEGSANISFENGKMAKVAVSSYETKTNRKKLINAYNTKAGSPLVAILALTEEQEVQMNANGGRVLIFHSGALLEKTTKDSQGVQVMTLRKGDVVESAHAYKEGSLENEHRYKAKSLPSRGNIPPVVQMTLEGMEE